MNILVQKYGGTSMADAKFIQNVARRVMESKKENENIVVVVSAPAGTTDILIEKAKEISKKPDKRELDMILSTGEQISISLLAMAIKELGGKAISYTAQQIGILTDGNHNNAKIESIKCNKVYEELKTGNVVILPGFQGITKNNQITTLGRGGSDTSAVALGVALKASEVEIYTDVDGVYTADPRIVNSAKKLEEISYDEMLELAGSGAKVLHSRSVELAAKNNIKIHLRSSFEKHKGTIVREEDKTMEKMVVRGVAHSVKKAKITIGRIPNDSKKLAFIFDTIAKEQINVDIITQNHLQDGNINVSFIVEEEEFEKAMKLSKNIQKEIGGEYVIGDDKIAKISVIGIGMKSSYGVAARVFSVISGAGITIDTVSTSDINISCIVPQKDFEEALNVIHSEFIV